MSIMTKTGDQGLTGLMYNRRVSKTHPQVEAYGTVDELNANLGLARATASNNEVREGLLAVQKDLVVIMGELATAPEDLPRFSRDRYPQVTPELVARLEQSILKIEAATPPPQGWAVPGANLHCAALDVARAVCRRAERRIWALQSSNPPPNPSILIYLNRLSDLLWLWARRHEAAP